MRGNLVPHPGPLVGRAAALAAVARLLASAPIAGLTGAPGVGKSRLAREAAASAMAAHEGSAAWWADLSGASTPDGVCAATAEALDLVLSRDRDAISTVGRALGARGPGVLVLDAADGAAGPLAAILPRWISLAPAIRFLVTSREMLRLPGERLFEVPALSVEDGAALLRELASAQGLEPPDVAAARGIAARLEGLPLAIELAAPRLRVFSPAALLDRLASRLAALPALKAVVASSFDLLDARDRAAAAAASAFRGGFTVDAAEAVIPGGADAIQSLREKSLLRAEPSAPGAAPRLALWESVREFAEEAEPEAAAAAQQRHATWYLRLCPGDPRLLARERENLLAVHARAAGSGAALESALALEPFFRAFGPMTALLAVLDDGLAAPASHDSSQHSSIAEVRRARGQALKALGRPGEAAAEFEQAGALLGEDGPPAARARLLRARGLLAMEGGRLAEADDFFAAALALEPDETARAWVRADRLFLRQQRGGDVAAGEFEALLAIARTAGDPGLDAFVVENYAVFRQEDGRPAEAIALHERALAAYRTFRDTRFEGIVLGNIGIVEQSTGNFDAAAARFAAALSCAREAGARPIEGMVLGYQASLLHERGLLDEAARGYDEAIAVLEETGARRQVGLFLALSAAVELDLGRTGAAEERRARSAVHLRDVGDPAATAAAEILEGHPLEGTPPRSDDVRLAMRLLRLARARWEIDPPTLSVRVAGRTVDLAEKPVLFSILAVLAERGGAASKEELVVRVWGEREYHPLKHDNRLQLAIRKLRSAIEDDASRPARLVTTPDGYALRDLKRRK